MRFSQYHVVITLALIALGFVARWFLGETSMVLLIGGAFSINLLQLLRVERHIQKLAARFFRKEKKNSFEIIKDTVELIELRDRQITNVVAAIGEIQEGVELISTQLEGEAGKAIQDLQSKLKLMKEEEAKQSWIVKGLAKMGEIRKSNSTLNDYAYQVISTLVKYLDANQGAFYTLQKVEDSELLELQASYAYGKRKYSDGKITVNVGVGLLGQSILERDLIFIKKVPKDYVKITSGLGEATPRCITIAPLIFREEVYGVMEIASFQVFEKHHLDFIRKVSEGIATELADVLRQEHTSQMLEQSQHQMQELKEHEEELRQNMEELQAIQEEMKRKETDLVTHVEELTVVQDQMREKEDELKEQLKQVIAERKKNQAILEGCVDGVISFDGGGAIQFFNRAAEEIFGITRGEILSGPITRLLDLHIVENKDDRQDKNLISKNGNQINMRTEITSKDNKGNEISVLLTATKVKLENEILFTLFVQKISVDLF